MKLMRMLILMVCLFAGTIGAAYASNFSEAGHKYFTIGYSADGYVYKEGRNKEITISVKKYSESSMILAAYVNGDRVYTKELPARKYAVIKNFYDSTTGRHFYGITLGRYQDGSKTDLNYIMGYDAANKKWQTYVNAANYYDPVPYSEGADIHIRHGDIYLSYSQLATHPLQQASRLFWDEENEWFGYEDLGMSK